MLLYVEYFLARAGIGLSDEEGQGLIEYVLIAGLISIAAIATIVLVGPEITTKFNEVLVGLGGTAPTP